MLHACRVTGGNPGVSNGHDQGIIIPEEFTDRKRIIMTKRSAGTLCAVAQINTVALLIQNIQSLLSGQNFIDR